MLNDYEGKCVEWFSCKLSASINMRMGFMVDFVHKPICQVLEVTF